MINSLADKEGAIGLINVMQDMSEVRQGNFSLKLFDLKTLNYFITIRRTSG